MKKNDQLILENIKSAKLGFCLNPKFLNKILGKAAMMRAKYGSPLKLKDIEKQ